jgi:hypothetical protein
VLQAGDNNQPSGGTQGPLYLNEYPTTVGGAQVQQAPISATGTVGGTGNQPITLDLTAAAGNGQLNRTYDGAGLVFGGVDSTVNNGGYTLPLTPTGTANRVIAVAGRDPAAGNFVNTTTYGPFYVGDDNRGGVADSLAGPVWSFGHPNQAGGAVSQGVLYFPGPNNDGSLQPPGTAGINAQTGVQVSNQTNIRGGFIGFNNVVYWTTAGSTSLGLAGIYQSNAAALPSANATGSDTPVVKALFAASKVGGMFIADVNADGILDNGDRIYLLDDGTVGGAGTGGLYMSVFDSTRWGGANTVTGQAAGWSPMVRIAEGDIDDQPNPQNTAQLRGMAGTVLSDGSVQLYASEFDNVAGNNSYIFGWNDLTDGGLGGSNANKGVSRVASATHSGNTATITLTDALPVSLRGTTTWLSVNSVGSGTGTFPTSGGFNGVWNATISADGLSFTFTDNNALTDVSGSGVVGVWLNTGSVGGALDPQPVPASTQILQSMSDGTLSANPAKAQHALRGVSFAPVAASAMSSFQVDGTTSETVTPGTTVHFSVHVSNPQSGVTLTGLKVTFIDVTTNTVLGQGAIDGSGNAQLAIALTGQHIVKAYFAGGGAQALAPATSSSTVTVNASGSTASTTGLTATIGGAAATQAAIGRAVTFTATVTSGATGTVSFYNGTTLIGSAAISGTTAILTTSFSVTGTASITATYNGDGTFAVSSSSPPISLTVGNNATAAITTSANNVAVGATPTYTATLTGPLGVVAGTVQFQLDGVNLGSAQTLNGSGVAQIASTALTAGSHLITIKFTPAATSPYNAFNVDTITSASGVALIETARQALTPGNLLAVQRGDGTTNLGSSGYLVFLAEYRPDGTLVQRIALPNADSGTTHALLLSGQNGSEGLLQQSGNGQFVTIVGYDTVPGQAFLTSSQPYQYGRTIARIDAAGNVDTSTSISTVQTAVTAATWSGGTATITTGTTNMGLVVGNPVTVSGVSPAGFNGTYTVTAVDNTAHTFSYALATSPGGTGSSGTATGPSVPYNPEDVVTNDGTNFWIASSTGTGDTTDSGLLYTPLGSSTATQIGPINHGYASIGVFGSQLFAVERGSGELGAPQGLASVGTGLPTTLQASPAAISTMTADGSGNVTVQLSAGPGFAANSQVVISGASNTAFNGAWSATTVNTSAHTFTFTSASLANLSATGGTVTAGQQLSNLQNLETEYESVFPTGRQPEQFVLLNTNDGSSNNPNLAYVADQAYGLLKFWKANDGNWHLGQLGTHNFGEKFVFAGGATGVIATIINPGTPGAKVNIYVTGSNVQQANPNQIALFQDQNGAPAGTSGTGVDQGFSAGNFSTLAFVGGTPGQGAPTSPNGNMNFAGLAFVPGFVKGNIVVDQVGSGSAALTGSATASFLNQYDASGVSKGSVALPIGGDVSTITAANWLAGLATITAGNDYKVGQQVTISGVTPSLYNGTFIVKAVTGLVGAQTGFTFDLPLTAVATASRATDAVTITAASWANVNGGTVTISATNSFTAGQTVIVSGITPTAYNGTFVVASANSSSFTYLSPNPGNATSVTGAKATPASPVTNVADAATALTITAASTASQSASVTAASSAASNATITAVSWASANGGTVTVTAANSFSAGQVITIAGVSPAAFSGNFTIASATSTNFTITNFGANPGTATFTGTATATGYIATITAANSFIVGQSVTTVGISGSLIAGGYNGTFTVASATATSFTYNVLAGNPGTGTVSSATASGNFATINTATLPSGLVGQSVIVANINGSVNANYNGTEKVTAVDQGGVAQSITNAVFASNQITFTATNTFLVGQTVTVASVNPTTYNGTYTVLSATGTQFVVAKATDPGAYVSGGTATGTAALRYAVLTNPGTADLTAGPTVTYNTATVTASNSYAAGNSIAVAGVTGATTFNGTVTILTASSSSFTYYVASNPITGTKFGTANVLGALTESGIATGEGYITNSSDGHTLVVSGYNQVPGSSTSANNSAVGVVNAAGVVDTTTQMPSQDGNVRAVASPDGLGMWIATGTGIRYVPFGNTPSQTAISAASWAPTGGGTATITAANSFTAGQIVAVTGLSPSGYNGTIVVLSATSGQFTYALATNPGPATTVAGSFAQLLPTRITDELTNAQGQAPTVVTIGSKNSGNGGDPGTPGQLVSDAGAQFQNNGVPSIDGPFYIGSGLSTSPGNPITVLGTGTDPNWPAVRDFFGNFPSSNQLAISPSGNTIVVADSRTDGLGGLLVYFQAVPNSWVRLANLQLDNFAITNASETAINASVTAVSNNTVTPTAASWINGTVTITAANTFTAGQKVIINGFTNAGYNGNFLIASASATSFTYAVATNPGTPSFSSPTATLANITFTATNTFVAGQNVTISGDSNSAYNGTFAIASATATTFTVVLATTSNPGAPGATATATVNSSATITTSSPVNFTVGQTVSISGVDLPAYNTTSAVITSVSGNTFTYNPGFSNLASSGPSVFGAFATSQDGGFRALTADWSTPGSPVLYATTTATSGNRLYKIPMTLNEGTGTASLGTPVLLATAPTNTAFRGVGFAPSNPGTTASTTSLTVTGSPADYGSGVQLQATVTSGATGWVSFRTTTGMEIGSAPLNSSGSAMLSTGANLAAGTYSVVAVYTGDGTYNTSTSAAQSVTINKASTSTSVTLSPSTVGTGQTETLTALVAPESTGAPTGTVTFWDGPVGTGTNLGTVALTQVIVNQGGLPVVTYQARLATTFAATGAHAINAAYSGDVNFNSSTGNNTLQVVPATTTTVTSDNANPGPNGATLNLTATVTPTSGTATGTVQFYDDTLPIGNPITLSSGAATLQVTTTPAMDLTIKSASATSAGVVTITTDVNNPLAVGQVVTIEGVATGAGAANAVLGGYTGGYNGTFTVTAVSGFTFSYNDPTAAGLATDAVGGKAIGRGVSTAVGATITNAVFSGGQITFTANNSLVQGDTVTVAGVNPTAYNGTYIVNTASGTQFTVFTAASPGSYVSGGTATLTGTPTGSNRLVGKGLLTPGIHSISAYYNPGAAAFGLSGGVHQQNVQAQIFGTGDVFEERLGDGITPLNTQPPITFNGSAGATNFIDEFNSAGTLVQTISLPSADSQNFAISAISGNGTTVTVTTSAPNDFANGQKVTIAGVTGGTGTFNGDFVINVTNSTTFTYSASGNGTGTVTGATAQGVVHAVVGHGQQSTTGQMTLSGDGQYLFLTGYDQNPNPADPGYASLQSVSANTVPRSIARIKFDGTIDTEAFTTGSATGINTGGVFNAVFSPDGNKFYVGGPSGTGAGIYYFPAFTTSATLQGNNSLISAGGNLLSSPGFTTVGLESYGGTLYAIGGGSGSGTNLRIVQVGTAGTLPTTNTGLTVTQLPGIPTDTSSLAQPVFFPVDAYFTHLNGAGTALDTIYVSDDGKNFGQGAITKWSLVGGNWTESTVSMPYSNTVQQLGFYYVSGTTLGGVVTLNTNYGNGGNADFGPGFLYSMTDASGYNVNPGIPITAASWSSGKVTITANNNYAVGQYVTISGIANAAYNGRFVITDVTASNFKYAIASDPGASGSVTGALALSINTVAQVAPGPVGGPWYGNETFRGNATSMTTTSTLVDNGISAATAGGSIEVGYAISFTASVTDADLLPVTGGTVNIEDASNGNAIVGTGTVSGGVANISVSGLTAGTHQLFAQYVGTGLTLGSASAQVPQVIDSVFKVQTIGTTATSNMTPTDTGYQVVFNAPVQTDSGHLNVSGGGGAPSSPLAAISAGLADPVSISTATESGTTATIVTSSAHTFQIGDQVLISGVSVAGYNGVVIVTSVADNTHFTYTVPTGTPASLGAGTGGSVGKAARGSFVWDGPSTSMKFVQTGTWDNPTTGSVTGTPGAGVLTPGAYNVYLSGTNAFAVQDTHGHVLGSASGTGGADFVSSFTVASSTTPIVSAPDIARGFGQGVNILSPNSTGILGVTDDASGNVTVTTGAFGASKAISTLSEGGSGTTVTVTTSSPHGLSDGLALISGASVAGYNGSFTIHVTDSTHFTYTAASGLADATGGVVNAEFPNSSVGFAVNDKVQLSGESVSGYNATDTNGALLTVTSVTGGTFVASGAPASLAAGFGGAVETWTGMPISISNPGGGSTVTSADFDVVYDTRVMTISGGQVAAASGFTGTVSANGTFVRDGITYGKMHVHLTGGSLAAGSAATIVAKLIASVPTNAPYENKEMLDIQNIQINGGSSGTGRDGAAVHVAAFEGDADGSKTLTGADATSVSRWIAGVHPGLTDPNSTPTAKKGTYNLADPAIVGAPQLAANATGADSRDIQKAVAGNQTSPIHVPSLPNEPTAPAQGGPDPTLFFPTPQFASPGTSFTVPVDVTNNVSGGINITSADLAILFDPNVLQITNVTNVGTLLNGFSETDNIDNTNGSYRVVQSTAGNGATEAQNDTQPVIFITFMVKGTAQIGSSTPLNLAAQVGNTVTNLNGGALTLTPAPTNSGNDAGVDGTLNVVAQSAKEFLPNTTVTAGSTFVEQLSVTAGPVPITVTSADSAILFDPNVLQITNVTNAGGLLNGFSETDNIDNTNGSYRVVQSTAGNGASLNANQSGTLVFITFQVNGNAAGNTIANLAAQVGTTVTNLNGGAITLSPVPTNANTDAVDGTISVIAAPTNQPPFDNVPGPQKVLSGGNLVFSGANLNAITVSDHALPTFYSITNATESSTTVTITTSSNPGYAVGQSVRVQGITTSGYNGVWTVTAVNAPSGGPYTFTYTAATGLTTPAVLGTSPTTSSVVGPMETGNEQTTLSVAHGTLTKGATVPGTVTVTGNGTATLQLTGPVTDITTALNGLTYVSTAGFSGGDTLTVSTNDQGNSGAGGAMTDSHSVGITDVRLFINEVNISPPDPNNLTADPVAQYLEIRSSVPSFTLPAGTYLIGANGQNPTGSFPNNPTAALGLVQDEFDLSSKQTGTNGILTILETGNSYATGGVLDAAGTTLTNTGSAAGFGNGASSSVGHTGLSNDLQTGSATYFLLQASTGAPVAGTTTIDSAGNGTINGGATATWNIQDSVGFTDSVNTSANVDHGYGAINFVDSHGTGAAIGTTISMTPTAADGTINYLARNANSTGSNGTAANPDWIGGVVVDASGGTADNNFNLGSNAGDTSLAAFGGRRLNNVSGLNFFLASVKSMVVNDGQAQRSQVTGTTVNFTLVNGVGVSFLQSDLPNIFKVHDAANSQLTLNFTVTGTLTAGTYTNVSRVVITYATTSVDTYTLGRAIVTPSGGAINGGSTQALNDGNYFLTIDGSKMTDTLGAQVDAAGLGTAGSMATIEFYRLFGDFNGDRTVDYIDQNQFRQANGGNATGTAAQIAQWRKYSYFDYDGNGLINGTDFTQFLNRRGTTLAP